MPEPPLAYFYAAALAWNPTAVDKRTFIAGDVILASGSVSPQQATGDRQES
jgi:hypothetical protein